MYCLIHYRYKPCTVQAAHLAPPHGNPSAERTEPYTSTAATMDGWSSPIPCYKVVTKLSCCLTDSVVSASIMYPQIASIRWANVGILLAPLLVRRWQMTLAICRVAHRADGWFDVSPTSPAYVNVYVMPTIISQVSLWTNVGSSWFKGTTFFQFFRKSWFSLLFVIDCL